LLQCILSIYIFFTLAGDDNGNNNGVDIFFISLKDNLNTIMIVMLIEILDKQAKGTPC
jgi:hypothetical protein